MVLSSDARKARLCARREPRGKARASRPDRGVGVSPTPCAPPPPPSPGLPVAAATRDNHARNAAAFFRASARRALPRAAAALRADVYLREGFMLLTSFSV
ncbi:MAG TPA: hypothetical protein VFX96_13800 [Pyrinomonadaceae bacterium]|nr:hypothetical protein [Pyrinomonadaceae bacterium]